MCSFDVAWRNVHLSVIAQLIDKNRSLDELDLREEAALCLVYFLPDLSEFQSQTSMILSSQDLKISSTAVNFNI